MPSAYHTSPARSRAGRTRSDRLDGITATGKGARNPAKALLMIAALLPALSACGSGPTAKTALSSNDRLMSTRAQNNPEGGSTVGGGGGWFGSDLLGGAVT